MSQYISFTEHKKNDGKILLEIQLNNPQKLNALNLEMILALNKEIKKWKNKDGLSLIFIHSGEARAFCAGGDVAQVYFETKKNKGELSPYIKDFFQKEYETDYMISQLKQPVVLWGDGIVMGGGMGLFMSASHPIATENSLFAMPEASIGFFTDVGASYFLNQMPNDFGRYVALTACRLNARSAQFLNLSQWFFLNQDKKKLFHFLKENSFKDKTDFTAQFQSFYKTPDFLSKQACWIEDFKQPIQKILEHKDLPSFYNDMSQHGLEDKTWEQNRKNFLKSSPSSLAVIWEQLTRAKKENNKKAIFEMEMAIAFNMSIRSDFPEGVRALLVDKTKDPKWNPDHVSKIDFEEIQKYFIPKEAWDCSLKV